MWPAGLPKGMSSEASAGRAGWLSEHEASALSERLSSVTL